MAEDQKKQSVVLVFDDKEEKREMSEDQPVILIIDDEEEEREMSKEQKKQPVILVIDDDDVNRQVITIILKREGLTPVLAEDGKSGLDLARTASPDLILLDIFMPDEDGFEVLRNLKQEPDIKEIPVIIFTILERDKSRKKALELGACDYITKPFDMKEIVVHIRNFLANDN